MREPLADLRIPALIALGSRAFSVSLIAMSRQLVTPQATWPLHTADTRPVAAWDAQWFLSIAASGYHAQPICVDHCLSDFAFPPAWPLLIRAFSLGGSIDPGLVAALLANLLFVAAAVLVFVASRPVFGEEVATRGVALFSFGPAAYVASLAYSESLFLLLVAVFFVARRPGRTSLLAAFTAQLVRITGLTLAGVALWEAWQARGTGRRALLLLASGPLAGLGLWWGYVAVLTGNPAGLLQGIPGWYRYAAGGPGLASLPTALSTVPILAWLTVFVLVTYLIVALAMVRRDARLGVFALLTVAAALLGDWHSMPRYLLPAFPVPMLLALYAGRRGTAFLWGAGAVAQAVFLAGVIGAGVVAP